VKLTRYSLLAISIAVLALAGGCTPADADATEEAPKVVAFGGKPDEKFAGKYKTVDGDRTYSFESDGKFRLDGTIDNRGQKMPVKVEGAWSVDGDRFLVKDQSSNVVPYTYTLEGKTLTLTLTGSMKNKTILTKQ
jgi:hypothetical protein